MAVRIRDFVLNPLRSAQVRTLYQKHERRVLKVVVEPLLEVLARPNRVSIQEDIKPVTCELSVKLRR